MLIDISSDSYPYNEYSLNNFNSEKQNQFNQQFSKAFNIVFQENKIEDDNLLPEKSDQKMDEDHTNIFIHIPAKPTEIISEENYCSKTENQLFNKQTEEYNNLDKYSKESLFEVISGQRKRVDMPDIMRKRIKSDYYRNIFKYLNALLNKNKENSNLKFGFLPQCLISNVTKDYNKKVMEMTLKEMILDKSFELFSKKKKKMKKFGKKIKKL